MNGEPDDDRALGLMALTLSPRTPPRDLRARVLEQISGADRYLPFASELSKLFDVSQEGMRELLKNIARPEAWSTESAPGLSIIHFAAGPAIVDRHAGFARLRQGFEIPDHRHLVEELTFVLEGFLVDSNGICCGPGELIRKVPGSTHVVTAVEDSVVATLVGSTERA